MDLDLVFSPHFQHPHHDEDEEGYSEKEETDDHVKFKDQKSIDDNVKLKAQNSMIKSTLIGTLVSHTPIH
jgi:hypothetical protein